MRKLSGLRKKLAKLGPSNKSVSNDTDTTHQDEDDEDYYEYNDVTPLPKNQHKRRDGITRRNNNKLPANLRRSRCCHRFSVKVSTEDQFKIDLNEDDPLFVGAFGQIRRQQLDYDTYHSHYRKERQWLHDSIIEDYLENDVAGLGGGRKGVRQPATLDPCGVQWLVFAVGVQGAGKQFVLKTIENEQLCPPILKHQYCSVDTDHIRRLLPEYNFYVGHAQELVEISTQKEAGYIAETFCWAALQAERSVVWDTSLRYAPWFAQDLIPKAKRLFPQLRVAVIHVTASPKDIQKRRRKKEKETGRRLYPDEDDFIETETKRIADDVEILSTVADAALTISNTKQGLQVVDDEWEQFMADLDTGSKRGVVPPNSRRAGSNRTSMLSRSTTVGDLTQSRRGTSRRSFDVNRTTEENHSSGDLNFYGRFANIRATLDYSYHRNYTFERQRFQDAIIQHFLQGAVIIDEDGVVCSTPTEPWIVFTAGPMGAGKSYTMRQLVDKGRFPLMAFVNVDPDELRRHLPEYHLYVNHSPEHAGMMTHKEAGFLAEILTLAALQAGKNVLQDGSLRDAAWYQQYFGRLRTEFPILRLAILQVTAPKDTILARAAARGQETGRVVPETVLLEAYHQVPRSVKVLSPLVDYHATLNNPPDADDIELVTEGESWESFGSKWVQVCAWVPKKKLQNSLLKRADSAATGVLLEKKEDQ